MFIAIHKSNRIQNNFRYYKRYLTYYLFAASKREKRPESKFFRCNRIGIAGGFRIQQTQYHTLTLKRPTNSSSPTKNLTGSKRAEESPADSKSEQVVGGLRIVYGEYFFVRLRLPGLYLPRG